MTHSVPRPDVIVIGSGVSGLSAARTLAAAGKKILVLERSRGVGGRCATRRVDGQPVDHGVAFLHGRDPAFLAELQAVPSRGRLEGWPVRVRGSGNPCQPVAYDPGSFRMAFPEGVSAFPKYLAHDLDIRFQSDARRLRQERGRISVELESETLEAPVVVLALAVEQSLRLLGTLEGESRQVRSIQEILTGIGSLPCLALIAGYDSGVPAPDWDVWYPEDSPVFQTVIHDSAKRREPGQTIIVYQALPRWSASHLMDLPDSWARSMLAEAARSLGEWAGSPRWTQPHRWEHARTDEGSALAQPVLIKLDEMARLGIAGDTFSPDTGGVESAWTSGRRIAGRITEEGAS